MVRLIPVQYKTYSYPAGITPRLQEVAGHFGKEMVHAKLPFSLHTEYSAGARTLSRLAAELPAIRESQARSIPMLWTSEEWAAQFASFVHGVCGGRQPAVLEIHPPFQHTCTFEQFFQRFAVFEQRFRQWSPHTTIVLENRCGNRLSRRFLFCTYQDFLTLSALLDDNGSALRIALDVPQLFTAHRLQTVHPEKVVPLLQRMKAVRHHVASIHLWGNHNGANAHWGNLDTYFGGDPGRKTAFLDALYDLLNDDQPRFFVPEVNSSQADLNAIVGDLLEHGFHLE